MEELIQAYGLTVTGNVYSDTVSALNVVVSELATRGEEVPEEWHYPPGVKETRYLAFLVERVNKASTPDLMRFGESLSLVIEICHERGWVN